MLKKRFHKDIIWYDFIDPTEEEFSFLAEQNNIDKYIVKKFLSFTNRDKVLVSENYLFISISFPNLKEKNYEKQSIKFIIGRDKIFTSQAVKNEGLTRFVEIFESNEDYIKNNIGDNHVAFIFLHMIEKIYENAIFELQTIEKEIDKIEEKIFNGNEKETVMEISLTNRKLIDFKKSLNSHDETWPVFLNLASTFFKGEEDVNKFLKTIVLSYRKVMDITSQLTELLSELRNTNNSLLQNKINQISREFTLIAFLTLPITLFVSIISIPTKQSHFLGMENDFLIALLVSFALFLIALMFSKYKKWW